MPVIFIPQESRAIKYFFVPIGNLLQFAISDCYTQSRNRNVPERAFLTEVLKKRGISHDEQKLVVISGVFHDFCLLHY
jgi:hypothetical protein